MGIESHRASCAGTRPAWNASVVHTLIALGATAVTGCGKSPQAPRPPVARSEASASARPQVAARPADLPPRPAAVAGSDAAPLDSEGFDLAERLVADLPDDPRAVGILAAVHLQHADQEGAVTLWKRCLALDGGFGDAHRKLGEVAAQRGDFKEAERCYRLALAANPAAVDVVGALSDSLLQQADFTAAAELLEAFLAATPGSADAWCTLGKTRLQQGDAEAARVAYGRALERDPESRDAHQGMGRALVALGDEEAARPHLERVGALQDNQRRYRERLESGGDTGVPPEARAAALQHAVAVVRASRGDLARAEVGWRRALELDPDAPESRQALAGLCGRTGRAAEAVDLLRAGCERHPDDARGWMLLGRFALDAKRPDEAVVALDRAIGIDPGLAEAWGMSARAVAPRDAADALRRARRAVEIDPGAPQHYVLADMLLRNGDRAGAIEALERAVELAPDDPRYRATLRGLTRGP